MTESEPKNYIETFKKIEYSPTSPRAVVKQSLIVMSLPRSQQDESIVNIGNSYLLDSTLNLVDLMEQGLYIDVINGRNFTSDEKISADQLVDPRVDEQLSSEAFGIARTTLSEMPDRMFLLFGQYRVPFSRRGYLRPPSTLIEHQERLDRIRIGVVDFATNKISKSRRYARAFFWTGATTLDKTQIQESEAREEEEYRLRKMFDAPVKPNPNTIFEQ